MLVLGTLSAAAPAAATAASIHWDKGVRLESTVNGGLNAVACPSSKLCLAVDASGYLVTTTHPTGGKGSWTRTVRIDSNALTGIACPSTKLCVAVDDSGNVLSSTNPAGGAKQWTRPARIDSTVAAGGGFVGLTGIDCPSGNLCIAVDGAPNGNVLSSTSPAGGARTWKSTTIGGALSGVSCPSASLCVVAGTQHSYSADPAAGTWHATGPQTGGGVLSAIACPSQSLCVGVGFGNSSTGLATSTTDPRGAATAWKTVGLEPVPPVGGSGLLDAVGCAGSALCVAVDSADNAYYSTAAAGGVWSGGGPIRTTPVTQSNAISCTSAFCVVVDSAGVETTGIRRG